MKVEIVNLHKSYKLNEFFLRKIIRRILKFCASVPKMELKFIFLDDRSIKGLNKKYRGKDKPTDVLTFNIDNIAEAYISVDRARCYSKTYGLDIESEITLYVIHAILHMFGYDDESPKERKKMIDKQERILRCLKQQEDLSKVLMPR